MLKKKKVIRKQAVALTTALKQNCKNVVILKRCYIVNYPNLHCSFWTTRNVEEFKNNFSALSATADKIIGAEGLCFLPGVKKGDVVTEKQRAEIAKYKTLWTEKDKAVLRSNTKGRKNDHNSDSR